MAVFIEHNKSSGQSSKGEDKDLTTIGDNEGLRDRNPRTPTLAKLELTTEQIHHQPRALMSQGFIEAFG